MRKDLHKDKGNNTHFMIKSIPSNHPSTAILIRSTMTIITPINSRIAEERAFIQNGIYERSEH